jgi:putative oxidoreductase
VDRQRLVQFALLGSSDLEQYAILLVRVSLGLFFAISGGNKLFVASSTQTMYQTLVDAKVPFPGLMTYFVSGVESIGGSLLTVGFLSSLVCVAFLIDMLVAILTTKLSTMPKGLSSLNWLDDFLYLPEVLYVRRLQRSAVWRPCQARTSIDDNFKSGQAATPFHRRRRCCRDSREGGFNASAADRSVPRSVLFPRIR